MAESMGWQAKMAIDSETPFDTSSIPLEFLSESVIEDEERLESEGIRGTRSRHGERVGPGLRRVGGSIRMNPSPGELDHLLPLILGAAENADVFALADTLPDFQLMIDKVASVATYADCKVASAVFSGQSGQKLELMLNVVGKSATFGSAGTFPAITIDLQDCYVFHQGVLSLGGTPHQFNAFSLTIENGIDPEFNNSQTATDLTPGDRVVTFETSLPYTSTEASLYTTGRGAAGIAGVLTFTSGGRSTAFTMNSLKANSRTPAVAGRNQRIKLERSFRAYMTGTTREISVTNDSTA